MLLFVVGPVGPTTNKTVAVCVNSPHFLLIVRLGGGGGGVTNITAGERKVPVHLCKKGAALSWDPEISFIKHLNP